MSGATVSAARRCAPPVSGWQLAALPATQDTSTAACGPAPEVLRRLAAALGGDYDALARLAGYR